MQKRDDRGPAGGLGAELARDVEVLAGEIGERNVWFPEALEESARFVERSLGDLGLVVSRQGFRIPHGEAEGTLVHNIEGELRGTHSPERVLVVGAHYDTRCACTTTRSHVRVPGEPGTPGANDNGSGVAAVLAIARAFVRNPPPITVRFVGFVNEEPPFFQTDAMGSWQYARRLKERAAERGETLIGAVVPETLGYYTDEPGSQTYPPGLGLGRPKTGNFLAFLSNLDSRPLLDATAKSFAAATDFPHIAVALPAIVPRVGWSDDWGFWRHGLRGICVTDTAFLRYPHYHTTEDTPDKLDYPRFALAVDGLTRALEKLAEPSENL